MSCLQTIQDYALRSIGYGERLLPRTDFTLCDQFTLIGSGMIWNIYYGIVAIFFGFFFAVALAMGKNSRHALARKPAEFFIYVFRGSPLFIQFFFAYAVFLSLKQAYPVFQPLTAAWLGATVVLFCNTSAYSAEIFYGALRSIPKGDLEAADAYGIMGLTRFRRITFPTMLRLAWPSYTNEAIFLFHATALVSFSSFPVRGQQGDALYYASYFADKTFNPFVPYPILAMYFILLTLVVITVFGLANRHLNRHLPQERRKPARVRLNLFR
ncbi:Histidine transport system permease protein HisM [Aliiroseovarius sp. xm-m-379]|uniref:ABC transporter permease n=1 Tax=unclassified Aliiroseovarius TaxID=2623558 RepID=UPI001569841B|nr:MULTISPECIES: ABC transporter permease subunit [unclassified Aliiroseovarius]NRP12421.1 Histidine transport system permease protein HisM [Aliiroseovarius sp. xm-d-517]NRP24795.1 Histidine transport system permease protein HisM [Aliiroseovarius sp. xm-m-379]NRP30570.1 Histidine transport system permease protein HisM [Aliiroseovarius sp. xm-m-314]NRP33594.1 Histidine transport system permease protein HisM [Aliiroseovarius sp. xm-a-104]NRP40701.1 Histidine transport system permease protein His